MLKDISNQQHQKLHDIAEAMKCTGYGHGWPSEYSELFRLWGFFNSIYSVLYTDPQEWQKISRFALDSRFNRIWDVLSQQPAVQELARQPCVGDGRKDKYDLLLRTRISFHTLRLNFDLDIQDICQSSKCQLRQQQHISLCLTQTWPDFPQTLPNTEEPNTEDAKFTPLGATLLIVYQVRNNLFHGSKTEIAGSELERNKLLVKLSNQITRSLLEEIEKLL